MKLSLAAVDFGVLTAMLLVLYAILSGGAHNARTRSGVALAHSQLRLAAVAVENYAVDFGIHPYDGYNSVSPVEFNFWYLNRTISTPTPYLSTARLPDPFRPPPSSPSLAFQQDIRYTSIESTWGTAWDGIQTGAPGASVFFPAVTAEWGGYRLASAGPDGSFGPMGFPGISTQPPYAYPAVSLQIPYDPTNGTISLGDIMRSETSEFGYTNIKP